MTAAMVEAVPMVMQCPSERAMPSSISAHSSSVIVPARRSCLVFPQSLPRPERLPRHAVQHRPCGQKIDGKFASRAHDHAGSSCRSRRGARAVERIRRNNSSTSMARRLR